MKKLWTLREISKQPLQHNSVRERKERNPDKRNLELLERCRAAWENKRQIRETRQRVMNYVFGDQWGDVIEYRGGKRTEREYIKSKGNVPLSNNIMISIQNSVVGLYAKQGTEPVCFARTHNAQKLSDMMSATMQANWQDTHVSDILKLVFQDSLDGGVSLVRETYEERDQMMDAWTDYCNPNYAFWDGGSDPRHLDVNIIGMLHDVSREDLYFKFAKQEYGLSVDDLNSIYDIIPSMYDGTEGIQQNDINSLEHISFDTPSNKNFYRVIEVWTKETKMRYQCTDPLATNSDDIRFRIEIEDIDNILAENIKRKELYDQANVPTKDRAYIKAELITDQYWYYTFMSPDGTILCEDETPYEFHSHPFTLKLYPFVNGEVHPFMGNIIDQQRYINRLIVMHDMAARSSAKGITIVPIQCIPDGMTPEDFADEFTEYDGLLFYNTSRMNPNARPEIITSNAVQIGTYELLQLQMNLIRDISNVSGALQGKTPTSGTSASRYALETQNATTSLYSLLQDMTSFTESLAKKKCMIIKQFYDDKRLIINRDNTDMIEYDRMATRDVAYKISIKEAAATASYQTSVNDALKELLFQNRISTIQYLQHVNMPFADSLLQQLQSDEAKAQQEQMLMQQMMAQQQQMTPQQQQTAEQNTQRAQQMLRPS